MGWLPDFWTINPLKIEWGLPNGTLPSKFAIELEDTPVFFLRGPFRTGPFLEISWNQLDNNFIPKKNQMYIGILRYMESWEFIPQDDGTLQVLFPYPPDVWHIWEDEWFSELPVWWDMYPFPRGYGTHRIHGPGMPPDSPATLVALSLGIFGPGELSWNGRWALIKKKSSGSSSYSKAPNGSCG